MTPQEQQDRDNALIRKGLEMAAKVVDGYRGCDPIATAILALRPESGCVVVPVEPRKIQQTEFGHDGNCQSACLAMMLGLEIDQVPNFTRMGLNGNELRDAMNDWLRPFGLWFITFVKWQGLPWPPKHGYFIAGGVSPRGVRHAVIIKDGKLWFDPHPDESGIDDVTDVDVILPLGFSPPVCAMIAASKGE
jgi:hypothetical protein